MREAVVRSNPIGTTEATVRLKQIVTEATDGWHMAEARRAVPVALLARRPI